MEINEMNLEQIEQRMQEIGDACPTAEGEALDALVQECEQLEARRKTLMEQAEKRRKLMEGIASGAVGTVVRSFPNPAQAREKREYTADSPEYRTAFLKNLLNRDMTAEERAAFVHTTANTAAVIPTTMLNNIWDLVTKNHVIMGDITVYRTGTVIEVAKHTAIVQGDAKTVAENTANDDEQNTFVKVTLSGKDFSKHVDISYAMRAMALDAFEQYLTSEIATQLGEAMANDAVSTIKSGVDTGNKITTAKAGEIAFAELAKAFGTLERVNAVTVYATRATIYNNLVAMTDTTGRPIFQPSMQAGAEGTLLGARIKVEDSIAAGELLIGDPSKVLYNMVQDIMVETDRDIKKHVITYSGYARGEGVLIDPKAFALLTVKAETSGT